MRAGGRTRTRASLARTLTRRRFLLESSAVALGLPALLAPPGAETGREIVATTTPARGNTLATVELACATISGHSLLAAVRTSAPAEVRLRSWPLADPTDIHRTPWIATNAARVAKLPLPGAGTAGQEWAWRAVVRDPSAPHVHRADVLRTIPARPPRGEPSAFTFAFGCCTTGTPGIAFTNVRRADPQFFAMIGDFGYPDKPSDYHPVEQTYYGYVDAFARILACPRISAITESTPFFAVQDDHDYGLDDCDKTTTRAFAGQAFADLMPGGCYPEPNYRSWSVGDAQFFLTDNRRWKDPEAGPYANGRYMSVLGTAQRQWLLARMALSDARLKFVFIPMTMAWFWSRAEIQEINDFITDHVSGTVIFLSGDKHAAAVARYSARMWEFLAAPISNPTKHTTPDRSSAVIWTENGTGPALYNAYGLVDVDTLDAGTCTLRLMREDGVEMHRQTIAV